MIRLILVLLLLFSAAQAKETRFVLKTGEIPVIASPLYINLDSQDSVQLYRLDKDKKIPIPCQMEPGIQPRLWFLPDQTYDAHSTIVFEMIKGVRAEDEGLERVCLDEQTITLKHGDQKILSYQHRFYPAPEGVNPLYGRSGFIHPLYSPGQKVLTRIQPKDHYHHYGVWNPWTKARAQGREVDFWNLKKGQGRVRFAGRISISSGQVYSGFKVRQEHLDSKEKVWINEVWDVRAFVAAIKDAPVWIVDFNVFLNNALSSPIELTNYRYGGGIGFRATQDWSANSFVLTSEGKTRKDADGTRARWCDVKGGEKESSGILFLSHPNNREHPEPMRVWPPNKKTGQGDLFFEFCPIRHKKWDLLPNREYMLQYRLYVYDGDLDPSLAEILWKNYTKPLKLKVEK